MRSAFGIAVDFISLDWIEPRPIVSNSCIPIKSCFWDWLTPRPQPSHVNPGINDDMQRTCSISVSTYINIYAHIYIIYIFYIIIVLESRKFKAVDDFFVFMLQYNSIICLKKRNASYVVCRSKPYRYITPGCVLY